MAIESGARAVRLERLVPIPVSGRDEDDLERSTGEGMPEPPSETARFRIGIQSVRSAAIFEEGAVSRFKGNRWQLPAVEPDRWVDADAVVISTGGLSFPRTGSDGTGYALVQALRAHDRSADPGAHPLAADDTLCDAARKASRSRWS